jgi:hypothetical protein
MAAYVFYTDQPHKMRADGRNTFVASGVDEAAARVAAEALVGQPGALAAFAAVDITGAFPAFTVEGFRPVGAKGQSSWPTVTRGGDTLRGI